jgi:hypothetical protein
MSQFVNFNKRSVTLPPGCKDLMDVLAPARKKRRARSVPETFAPLEIHKERFPSAGLAQLERFVGLLLHPRGEACVVQIAAEALSNPIVLYCSKAEKVAGIALGARDVPQEETVRAFFHSRATEPRLESTHGGTATLLYPLPWDVAAASTLVRELIQEVFALGSDAGLDFEHYDIEKTG